MVLFDQTIQKFRGPYFGPLAAPMLSEDFRRLSIRLSLASRGKRAFRPIWARAQPLARGASARCGSSLTAHAREGLRRSPVTQGHRRGCAVTNHFGCFVHFAAIDCRARASELENCEGGSWSSLRSFPSSTGRAISKPEHTAHLRRPSHR